MKNFEVIIPCKAFAEGKSRLAPSLSARQRENLCRQMLERTAGLALAAAGSANVTVVSADANVLSLASGLGARPFAETGHGLNTAIHAANVFLLGRRTIATDFPVLVILPIDLPNIHADLIRDAVAKTAHLGIAPDEAEIGTNLLVLSGGLRLDFPFAFGPDSFRLHTATACARRVPATVLRHPDLAFDLDRPIDLKTREIRRGQLSSCLEAVSTL